MKDVWAGKNRLMQKSIDSKKYWRRKD